MLEENTDGLPGLFKKIKSTATNFGMRVVVHVTALAVAGFTLADIGDVRAALGVYLGLICLVPGDLERRVDKLIPTGMGVGLAALLMFPPPLGFGAFAPAVLCGGVLTWFLRVLQRRGKIGLGWAVLPMFFAAGLTMILSKSVIGCFAAFAVIGHLGYKAYIRDRTPLANRVRLEAISRHLAARRPAAQLPQAMNNELARLGVQLEQLLGMGKNPPVGLATTIDRLEQVTKDLRQLDRYADSGRLSDQWSPLLFSDGVDARDRQYADLCLKVEAELYDINDAFKAELERSAEPAMAVSASSTPAAGPAASPGSTGEDAELSALLRGFDQQVRVLEEKVSGLPPDLSMPVGGICKNAHSIIKCMHDDPQDREPGGRFLSRYLPAVLGVVDEYVRLRGEGGAYGEVLLALEKCAGILERLEKAFASEHERLLQNDVLNFSAEINLLDKLLKMQGQ